jgi:glyoxylase-like metal-dependent hydrolase (beta-lactamase superfamily II)
MQIKKMASSLYKITLTQDGFQVNLGVSVGEDGVLLVDTGWTTTAEDVQDKIRELDEGLIRMIIFTHQHGDHIGGRAVLGKDAVYVAHEGIRDDLEGRYHHLDPLPGNQRPAIYLDSPAKIKFNAEEIHIIPAPGHTSSDMIVHFVNSGVVFLGDLLFSDSFPALFTHFGGDPDLLISTLTDLLETLPGDVVLIAGHGRDYCLADLKEYVEMIQQTSNLIKAGLADGKDAEMMFREGILDDWKKWSTPAISTEDWIRFVSDCLSGVRRPPIAEPLTRTLKDEGVSAAIAQYNELKENQPDGYNFGEDQLNMLGYNLLWREMGQEAIEILILQAEIFPESANSYDSLGEVYEQSGELALAEENYRKALSIDPDFSPSRDGLDRVLAKLEE